MGASFMVTDGGVASVSRPRCSCAHDLADTGPPTSEAERIGHGLGYRIPHDPPGWVEQHYLPDELAGTRYYQPSEHGRETAIDKGLGARGGDLEWSVDSLQQ